MASLPTPKPPITSLSLVAANWNVSLPLVPRKISLPASALITSKFVRPPHLASYQVF